MMDYSVEIYDASEYHNLQHVHALRGDSDPNIEDVGIASKELLLSERSMIWKDNILKHKKTSLYIALNNFKLLF